MNSWRSSAVALALASLLIMTLSNISLATPPQPAVKGGGFKAPAKAGGAPKPGGGVGKPAAVGHGGAGHPYGRMPGGRNAAHARIPGGVHAGHGHIGVPGAVNHGSFGHYPHEWHGYHLGHYYYGGWRYRDYFIYDTFWVFFPMDTIVIGVPVYWPDNNIYIIPMNDGSYQYGPTQNGPWTVRSPEE